jgi:hypothetical protein
MKRTVVLEISLMAVGVLAGSAACSQPTQQTAVPLPTETVSLPAIPVNIDTPATTATPQPIETIAPVLTQTPTLPLATPTSAAPIQSRCPSRAKTFRPDLLKEGVVVLSDNDNLFLTSGSTQAKIALPMMTLKHSIWGISASGDKQRLKYVEEAQDSTGLVVDTWVWLVNSDGKKEKVYHWDKSAGQAFNGLGNRELVVGSMSYTYLSPFTNKWMTVEPSSLPEIQHFTGGILDPFPLVVPNTALSVVAYAGEGGRVLTLWSVSSHKVFAKMPGLDPITIPTWSPDGSQLAFSASSNVNDYAHTDLFSVTVDGHVKQLTHLEGFLPFVNVGDFSWSPMGGSSVSGSTAAQTCTPIMGRGG